jgi:hypothetical protein
MGRLKPGAEYVYEHTNGITYAREKGAPPDTRFEIGHALDEFGRSLHERIMEDQLWGNIRRAARTNPTLNDALERAIMIYHLSKK